MATEQQTIEIFNNNLNEYIHNYVRNNMYVIELTKCCGYGTFITIYKDETFEKFYIDIFFICLALFLISYSQFI